MNLIKSCKHAATIQKMKAALRAYMEKNGDPEPRNFDRFQRGEAMVVPQSPVAGTESD